MGQAIEKVKLGLLIALVLFLVSLAYEAFGLEASGFEAKDIATYFGTTDKEITVSWDHNDPLPDFCEIRLFHVERGTEDPAGTGQTAENSITFKLPRSGHFIAKVRACLESAGSVDDCDAPPCCGLWSESIDPEVATVDGTARGWWIYGYVAAPGAITIDPNPY